MGVDLGEIFPKQTITLDQLAGKSLAVDAYNTLYQFLAIIRQPDGTPLMDRRGRITSHLSGILYRTSNLAERGVRLAYVFDGEPPELKEMEIRRRSQVKEEATVKYEKAISEGRREDAKKYAQMTSRLKESMVDDAKRLLSLLGVPWVQAPSEGEAQAAFMTVRGDLWATASQDHDSLLFGTPIMAKNVTITGRRKLPGRNAYVEVEPETIKLDDALATLGLTREQIVDLGILIGTDFNPDGFKGVGPKKALKLIQEHRCLEDALCQALNLDPPVEILQIRDIFLNPKVTPDYEVRWREPDLDGTVEFLCEERDFSQERVRKALEKMLAPQAAKPQKGSLENYL